MKTRIQIRRVAVALILFFSITTFQIQPTVAAPSHPVLIPKPTALAPTQPTTAKEVYQKLLNGTVWITNGNMSGTGWIYDKDNGLIVTNHHVIDNAKEIRIYPPKYEDGELVTDAEEYIRYTRPIIATIVDSDARIDLAILKVNSPLPKHCKSLKLSAKSASPADRVHLCGGKPRRSQGVFVYANGHVRQVSMGTNKQKVRCRIIQTTLDANPGNSGGAIVNDQAEVVGVLTSGWDDVRAVTGGSDVKEVKNYLDQVKKLYPAKTAKGNYTLGVRHYFAGRTSTAIEYCTRAIRMDTKLSDAYRLRGYCFLAKQDSTSSVADFDQAIKLNSGEWRAFQGRASIHQNSGKLELAIKDYSEAIRLNPKALVAFCNRGIVHSTKGQFENAIKDFSRALAVDKKNYAAVLERGRAYAILGMDEKALVDFEQAVRLNPNATSFNNLGFVLGKLGQTEKSLRCYEEAIKLDPKNILPWQNLGKFFYSKGNFAAALDYLNQALRLDPKNRVVLEARGRTLFALGHKKEGLMDIDLAIKYSNRNADLYYTRAWMLDQLGYREDADDSYQIASKLDPKRFPANSKTRYTSAKPAARSTVMASNSAGRLAGSWKFINVIDGVQYDCDIVFRGNTFRYVLTWVDAVGRPGKVTKQGTFKVGKNALIFRSSGGSVMNYAYSFKNGFLFIQFPDVNEIFGFAKV